MAPPQLAADAPVLDVVQPLRVRGGPVLRHELDLARTHGLQCRFGDRLAAARTAIRLHVGSEVDEPLVGQHRLDHRVRALAYRHLQLVRPRFDQQPGSVEVGQHDLARVVAVESTVFFRRFVVDLRFEREDRDQRQLVAHADRVVIEVVRRGDFHAAGAEFAVDVVVSDHRDLTPGQWQLQGLADQVCVALVFRMHGHGDVAQHGFRARRRNHQAVAAVRRRVADRPHVAVALDVVHFQVGHRGAQHRVPVHQPVAAVDQAGAIPVDKHLAHRGGQALVHGEALARPVGGGADAAHLVGDGGAGFLLPLPYALDESVAPEVVPGLFLDRELVLHDFLGGDAGVIGTHLPQRVHAAHALVAHQHVHYRLLEGVAHVQRAGDIRRRQQDAVRLATT